MKLKNLMMGASIAAMMAGGAYAQNAEDTMTAEEPMAAETEMGTDMTGSTDMTGTTDMSGEVAQAPTFTSLDEMTVGDVVGYVAYDPEDNRIGEIDYVVANGDSADAIIGIGGFLGLGEYTVALPITDFELREDGMSFVLSTDKETLKEQPEFDEAEVEGLPDETPVADLLPAEEEPAADEAMGSDASASADDAVEGEDATEDMAAEAPAEEEGAADEDVAADTEAMDEEAEDDNVAAADAEAETETTVQ
ncbi:MAG: hypothetical protein VX874_14865 [Pseudomonadota bacterium]|nr:hypothetical protein [Pseudomonadota bacterium]